MTDTREYLTVELTNTAKTTFEIAPTGESDDDGNPCYAELIFDGANRGMWINNAVVELAREYGFDNQDSQEDIDAHAQSGSDGEMLLVDTCTYAESYLNEITPEGWSFGFNYGDFFLANDAWWSIADS